MVASEYWNGKLQDLEKTLIKFEHSWHLEDCNGLESLSKIHETIGELHEFVHECDENGLEECGIQEFLALIPQFPMLTTVTEREWMNLLNSICKLSQMLKKKHLPPPDDLLQSWLFVSADLLCHNLSTALELNVSKQDWASHSPYMRNKRITPGIVFLVSTFRRVTLQMVERLGKTKLLNNALLNYSLYMTTQVLESIIKAFWGLQPSRTRLTQIRNDLLYSFLQIFFIFRELLKIFHDNDLITDSKIISIEEKNYFPKIYTLFQIILQIIYFSQDCHMTNISVLFDFCENLFAEPEVSSIANNEMKNTKRLSISSSNFHLSTWSEIDFIFNQQIIQQWNLQEISFLFDELLPYYQCNNNNPSNTENHSNGLELLFSSLDMISLSPSVSSTSETENNNNMTTTKTTTTHQHHQHSEITVMALSSQILSDKNYHNEYKLHLHNYRMTNKMILFEKFINFQLIYSPEYLMMPLTSNLFIRKHFLQYYQKFFFDENVLEFFIKKDIEWKAKEKSLNNDKEETIRSNITQAKEEKSSSSFSQIQPPPYVDENSFWDFQLQQLEQQSQTEVEDGDEILKKYVHFLFQRRFEMIDGEYPKLSNEQQVLRNQNCQFLYKYKMK